MKSTFSIPVLLIVFLLTGLFYSCDSTIESHGYYYAPSRYTWDIDTLYTYEYDVVVFDSNSYFTISGYQLYHYINGEKKEYNIGHFGLKMDGTNENNLYIGGGKYISGYISYPMLSRFCNGTFKQINIGGDTAYENYVRNVKIINNDVWCGTMRGEVMKYNGSSVDYYKIDTTHHVYLISTDVYNNIYAIAEKSILDSNNIPVSTSTKVFVYDQGNWSSIYQHISDTNNYVWFYSDVVNKTICITSNGIYDFSIGNFTKILDKSKTGVVCYHTGGNSFNDLIMFAEIIGQTNVNNQGRFVHWNGISASIEQTNYDLINGLYYGKFSKVSDKYYLLFYHILTNSYLYIGTPIEQTKK